MTIPLRQLEAFRAVVAVGSITKAASYLSISQPAVSRLIASLEKNLDFALFQRRAGVLRPTQEAHYLFKEVERALTSLEHISQLTRQLKSRQAGHLRLTCLPGFATTLLPRVLAGFMQNHPGVTLTLEPDRPDRIMDWIIGQQFDVGISDQMSDHPGIENENIQIRSVCILPVGHPLSDKDFLTPTDLSGIPIIHGKRDHAFFRDLAKLFAREKADFNSWVETRQFGPACIMVSEGVGVSIVSEVDAREYEHMGKGLVIKPFKPELIFNLSLIYPAHMPRSMVCHEFMEVFKDSLKDFIIDNESTPHLISD
jgi:DNA-binding transcriptional LysR family regulator